MNEISNLKIILHVIDGDTMMPILSDSLITEDNISAYKYVSKLLDKAYQSPDRKTTTFLPNSKLRQSIIELKQQKLTFIELSKMFAENLYEIAKQNPSIPNADLIVTFFEYQDRQWIGVLKCNYKEGFTHHVTNDAGKVENLLIQYKAILPFATQKIEECALIDLMNEEIIVIEKKYEINGQLQAYLSEMFLGCAEKLSIKQEIDTIYKKAQEISNNNVGTMSELKNTLLDFAELGGKFEIEEVAERLFPDSESMQREYIARMAENGVTGNIEIDEKFINRKSKMHKIVTDTGVEISIPSESFSNRDIVEFQNNPDGKISIAIKNVGRITNK